MNTAKPCIKCNQLKSSADFDKGRNQCKTCRKDYLKSYYSSYYEDNKELLLSAMSSYKDNNRVKIRVKQSARSKNRRMSDPQYKLASNLRSRLSHALKNGQKVGSAISDLGCSIEELKKHIENQFISDMSWSNYGKWHIDHIKPLSSFDLTNPEELKSACYYTNLQPMWAEDNWSKGSKWR
jgi:hypothetical protein